MSAELFAATAREARERAADLRAQSWEDMRALLGSRRDRVDHDALVDACALAREATRRVLGVELHDGQVMAGAALAAGWTVQMRTGEGKTFAAIAPAVFHAVASGPVHVVTANAYLAERDAGWSGQVLRELGLTVGVTLPGRPREVTRRAYAGDVTFGAGVDFAFDHLRDCLHLPGDAAVQGRRTVAIIDDPWWPAPPPRPLAWNRAGFRRLRATRPALDDFLVDALGQVVRRLSSTSSRHLSKRTRLPTSCCS